MERLRNSTTPIPDESARGLVARACGDHNIPHSWMVLKHAGASFRNRADISETDNIDIDALGHILKIDASELRARTYPLLSSRRRSFFGIELSELSFETRVRRFSPAALRNSSYMRAVWEIRDLPYCMEGWDILQMHCRCGIKQGWTRMTKVHCCDDCGRPLVSRVEPIPVPVEYQAALSLPALLLSPLADHQDRGRAMLPNLIASQERSAIYDTIIAISKVLIHRRDATEWDRIEALHMSSKTVMAWPDGINELARPEGVSNRHWRHLLAKYEKLEPGRSASSCAHDLEIVGIRKAVALGCASREVLMKARDAGLLTEHALRLSGRGDFVAFEVAELKQFAIDYAGRLSFQAVAKAMGLPLYAVKQVVAAGRLPANGLSLAGEERFISEAAYGAFILELVRAATRTRTKCPSRHLIPLRLASQSIGGRLKPWGRIFEAMLTGEIRFVLRSSKAPLMHRIGIHACDAVKLRRLADDAVKPGEPPISTTIHKQDALEILNIAGDTPVLIGLPFVQRGGKLYYELHAVLDRAAKTISLPEISQRTGWSISRAFHEMRRKKVPLLFEGCWCRESAEKNL